MLVIWPPGAIAEAVHILEDGVGKVAMPDFPFAMRVAAASPRFSLDRILLNFAEMQVEYEEEDAIRKLIEPVKKLFDLSERQGKVLQLGLIRAIAGATTRLPKGTAS